MEKFKKSIFVSSRIRVTFSFVLILSAIFLPVVRELAFRFGIINELQYLFFERGLFIAFVISFPFVIEILWRKKFVINLSQVKSILVRYKLLYLVLLIVVLSSEILGAQRAGVQDALALRSPISFTYKQFGFSDTHFSLCRVKSEKDEVYYIFSTSGNSYFYNKTQKETTIKLNVDKVSLLCEPQEKSRETEHRIFEILKKDRMEMFGK